MDAFYFVSPFQKIEGDFDIFPTIRTVDKGNYFRGKVSRFFPRVKKGRGGGLLIRFTNDFGFVKGDGV